MAVTERREGQTLFGSIKIENCTIGVEGKLGKATGLILQSPDGTEWVLRITDAGVITISDYTTFAAATS